MKKSRIIILMRSCSSVRMRKTETEQQISDQRSKYRMKKEPTSDHIISRKPKRRELKIPGQMYFDHLTRVIKMAFVCIFQLFVVPFWRVALCIALAYNMNLFLPIYLSMCTSTCRSIYRNCLRFECSLVISKCWQKETKHETWNLCMWLIPFQSAYRFCSFSSFVFWCCCCCSFFSIRSFSLCVCFFSFPPDRFLLFGSSE